MKRLSRGVIVICFVCFKLLLLISCIIFISTPLSQDNEESWKELNQKAIEYYQLGNYNEAIIYAEKALIQAEKEFGKNTEEYATSLNNLALSYTSMDRYEEAEPLYKQAIGIYKTLPPKGKHPSYALSLNNLAALYRSMGRYEEAEPLHKQALEIYKTLPPKGKHPDYATGLNNLALFYNSMGRYEEAEPLYKQALEISKTLPPKGKHPDYARGLNNLALLFYSMGRYEEAEPLYKQALEIYKTLPPEGKHHFYATSLNNLAELYRSMGRYDEAEPLYTQALEINKTLSPEGKHPEYARNLNNLAELYRSMGRYDEAEPLYKQALEIYKTLPPEGKHHFYATSLNNLAVLYRSMGRYEEAKPYLINSITIYTEFIKNNLYTLNETEKEQFYNTIKFSFEKFYSFLEKGKIANSVQVVTAAYDIQLFNKAILFDSTKKMITRIRNSKDLELIEILNSWLACRDQLSKEYKEETAQKANELEKILANKSQDFAKELEKLGYTWKDVRNKLNKNEAAIEIVRYKVFDKKWTDTVHYAFLILKKSSKVLEIVFLKNGNEMENDLLDLYNKTMQKKTKGAARTETEQMLYTQYWEKIEAKLSGINRVYVSPDGVYNLININTLKDKNNNYYSEDIVRVASTRDIIEKETKQKNTNPSLVIGYPEYNLGRDKQAETVIKVTGKEIDTEITYTPALFTDKHKQIGKKEYPASVLFTIEELGALLGEKKIKCNNYTGNEALEEVIKEIESPKFLHIGTHGFFYGEKEIRSEIGLTGIGEKRYYKNPLHFCGLYLAGTNESIRQTPYYKGMDDGILTAYEVMNLNLDDTELVVLQACVTGLGDVKMGEGVYGLQRAFLTAGAKAVLMSLWEIPDKETSDFMLQFYQLWLAGKEKRIAFKEAVENMKEKYKFPYYWGAFILVGE